MVKSKPKLREINAVVKDLAGGKKKKNERKLKTLKSKIYIEKAVEKALIKQKKTPKKRDRTFGKLGGLGDALMEIETKQTEEVQQTKLSKKEAQLIDNRDTARVQAVLNHPSFQANPLLAIQQHLQSQLTRN